MNNIKDKEDKVKEIKEYLNKREQSLINYQKRKELIKKLKQEEMFILISQNKYQMDFQMMKKKDQPQIVRQ